MPTKKITKRKKGKRYTCKLCGLVVTTENVCGCRKECEIICCGEKMVPVK